MENVQRKELTKAEIWLKGHVTEELIAVATESEKEIMAKLVSNTSRKVLEVTGMDKDTTLNLMILKLMKRSRRKEEQIREQDKQKRSNLRTLRSAFG